MPELPEVETVCRGLAEHLINACVASVDVRRRNLRVPLPASLEKTLVGLKLLGITRRAKYILFHFEGGQVLVIHLGMSGRLVLHRDSVPSPLKHDHVIIEWKNGYTLIFNDARRFGLMLLISERALSEHALFKNLGPEPLDATWNATHLHNSLHSSRAPVKTVIMDQRKLVGVGNIYACEALFRSGIHPECPACEVTKKEATALAAAIKKVLEEAISSGGSTLRDYVRSSGDAGYFQHHFKVYGRENMPCCVCKKPVKAIRQSGRSTFFCARCQR